MWVAWRDPQAALLPEDGEPVLEARLDVGAPSVTIEPVITQMNQTRPAQLRVQTNGGQLSLRLTHRPVYVTAR
jgi:hypothetical protein